MVEQMHFPSKYLIIPDFGIGISIKSICITVPTTFKTSDLPNFVCKLIARSPLPRLENI